MNPQLLSSIETAIRLCVIGQELLIAAIFLFHRGDRGARIAVALLVTGIAAYLVASDPVLAATLSAVRPLVLLLALFVPCFLWAFARAIFEHPWPSPWISAVVLGTLAASWLVFLFAGQHDPGLVRYTDVLRHVVSLLVVLHALWFAARERTDDLLEGRRAFRVWFVLLVGLQTALILAVELAMVGVTMPPWLDSINVLVIAALTLGLAVPLLGPNPDLFARRAGAADGTTGAPDAMPVADRVVADELDAFMSDGRYRESGLTISALAGHLGCREYRLRRVINGSLGFRNFSAFLNDFRIRDARRMLADPELVSRPVLTIALELGYGSVGPFNRAFRRATGMSPTEYRRERLGRNVADSE